MQVWVTLEFREPAGERSDPWLSELKVNVCNKAARGHGDGRVDGQETQQGNTMDVDRVPTRWKTEEGRESDLQLQLSRHWTHHVHNSFSDHIPDESPERLTRRLSELVVGRLHSLTSQNSR